MNLRALPALALALVLLWPGAALAAPALRLLDPESGKLVELPLGAKALHLVFFATWCPRCIDELHGLSELDAQGSRKGYRLVIVAVRTRHDAPRLAEFIADKRPPGRLLFDSEGVAEQRWGAKQLPTHVVLDETGKEVARSSGLGPEIEAALERLLDERRGRRP
jgi:thiol-disulfide isomerase/thioredoxin